MGLKGTTLNVVKDIYTNLTTQIKIGKHTCQRIPCEKAVKQGCTLRPILFELALVDGMNKESFQFTAGNIVAMTYADYLCFVQRCLNN